MSRIAITVDPQIPVPPTFYGGIERVAFHLVETLIDRGHDVVLLAAPDSQTRATQIAYGACQSQGWFNTLRNSVTLTSNAYWRQFDIIHSFSRLAYMLPLLPLSVPKLMTYQRYVTPRSIRLAHRLARGTLEFTAVSRAMTDQTQHLVDWHLVPNMVDTETLAPEPCDSLVIDRPLVFVGRIEHIKGVHLAIRCARESSRRLVIAGNVPDSPHAREYFATQVKPHLGDGVEYVGPIDDTAKRRLLSSASALLMPILWDEPFGIVMAESLACATPIIALNRGSVPEVIEHRKTGFICDSLTEMVTAVTQLSQIDRQSCRAAALARFSTERVVSAYEQLYQRMILASKSRHVYQS